MFDALVVLPPAELTVGVAVGAEIDPRHPRRKGAAGIGVDREARGIAGADAADVRLVDLHVELHRGQVLGDGEQGRDVELRRHRLPRLDLPRQHDAVDRRVDRRLGEAGAVGADRRARLLDLRARRGEIGDRAIVIALGLIELGPRRHLAARQPRDLLVAAIGRARLVERRLILRDRGLRGGELPPGSAPANR